MMIIKDTFLEISNNFEKLAKESSAEISVAYELMIKSIKNGGKIIYCGNGGSAADSQHLAAELIGRYRKNRKPIPALALTTDTSIITAIANDFSFDEVFSRQIEALGDKNDVLYAISTSGKSRNIIACMKLAKLKNIKVIGLTGNDGSQMSEYCDVLIKTPSNRPDRIQEMHIAIGQLLCQLIEDDLY
ncbi:D-sedoheptulose 7-phosphate isomerase [Pelagibacterales bacterium SAG-MED32]|nr:D-sedoheptulose 7-phosphate isomerase [Pelagibacterales bacterium SAG-MED32]